MVSIVDEQIERKFRNIERRIFEAFDKVRAEMYAHVQRLDNMANFIRQKDAEQASGRADMQKTQEKIKQQVDEFDQKISQLRIALSSVKSLKNELVVRRDLSKIEDRTRTSFKNEVDRYKNQVKSLKDLLKEEKKKMRSVEKRLEKLENRKPVEKVVEKVVYQTQIKQAVKGKTTKKGKKTKNKKLPVQKAKKKKSDGWSFTSNFDFE